MKDETPSLKTIITTIYIGTVAFILFFFCIWFNYFNPTDANSQMVFWTLLITIYITFFSAGIDLAKLYTPIIKRFILKRLVDLVDASWLIFAVILVIALYFSSSQPISAVIAPLLLYVISIAGNRIWKRLKRKHKWLKRIESYGDGGKK